jgi:hypothetical protein
METFKALTPEEIKIATLQFMGQHLTGEMKELNKNIIGESSTLRGMTIDPVKVINSIAGPPNANIVNAGININKDISIQNGIQTRQVSIPFQPLQQVEDPNQLTFDFEKSSYAKSIFDHLDAINNKLIRIENLLNTLK